MKGYVISELRPDTARVTRPAVAGQVGGTFKQTVDRVKLAGCPGKR